MVSNDDKFISPPRNLSNSWPEDLSLSTKSEIARKFYPAPVVPQTGVGLDHPTWK